MDVNKTAREEARQQLHKNAASNIEQSWRQHATRHQLYGHLLLITKTIQVRRTRNAGHCWRSRDELISDVLQWTPTYGRAKAWRPAWTYIQQLCEDTGCSPEDLLEVMNDREKWRERVSDICARDTTWWWWWLAYCRRNLKNMIKTAMSVLGLVDWSDLIGPLWPSVQLRKGQWGMSKSHDHLVCFVTSAVIWTLSILLISSHSDWYHRPLHAP